MRFANKAWAPVGSDVPVDSASVLGFALNDKGVPFLAFDNPANGAASLVPGSSTVIANHQCSVRGANSTVVAGTTSLVITVDLLNTISPPTDFGRSQSTLAAISLPVSPLAVLPSMTDPADGATQ